MKDGFQSGECDDCDDCDDGDVVDDDENRNIAAVTKNDHIRELLIGSASNKDGSKKDRTCSAFPELQKKRYKKVDVQMKNVEKLVDIFDLPFLSFFSMTPAAAARMKPGINLKSADAASFGDQQAKQPNAARLSKNSNLTKFGLN